MRFLDPEPHMALAKFYYDKGNRLQSFYMLEAARRGRFEEEIFNKAFHKWFAHVELRITASQSETQPRDDYNKRIQELFEKDPARARVLIEEAIAKYPSEGQFHFTLGALLQREGKLQEAEVQLVKAADLSPDSSNIQAWVGRFFFKVKGDNQRALVYYLNSYFLDPHAYESEYVESRIRKINWGAAAARVNQLTKNGTPITKIVQDENPTVALLVVMWASENWRPEYLDTMVTLMGHEDEEVRWQATEVIKTHVDRTFDQQLKALLQDKDLRKRGLAAYISVHLWKQESFPLMRNMLREEAQLLRFDALSASILEGGPAGRRLVLEHKKSEANPALKKLIEEEEAKRD
jgi:tetratricopeptide (TPR) repeat protein